MGLAVLAFLLAVGSAAAEPGVLDPSFGAGSGEVTTGIGTSASADAVVVQPDGKIVTAGGVVKADSSRDFALARYEPDGTLDSTFGSGGIVQSPAGAASAVALQPDGEIVAAGTASNQIRVARYNADGSLDESFGSGGAVTTAVSGSGSVAKALVLQPDGKIVVGGDSSDGLETLFTLVRYDANGSLDSTFGNSGVVTTQVGTGNSSVDSLALQSDGKIVADGDAVDNSLAVPGLARYNADGSLDTTFGSGGIVTTPVFGANGVTGGPLALQPDGKIVTVATWPGTVGADWFPERYLSDGSLDPSFHAGEGFGANTSPGASSLVLLPDGKIAVAGFGSLAFSTSPRLVIARWDSDGTTDGTFSPDGGATIAAGTGSTGTPAPARAALALQPDGRLVVVGSESENGGATQQFLLARLGASTITVGSSGDFNSADNGGQISSSPAGIDCSTDLACLYPFFSRWQHAFAAGPVTLTATPSTGWHFAGWSGDGCSGTGTCQVQMSGDPADDQHVNASFVLDTETLVVRKAGSGAGDVTSNPSGINCGSDCTYGFAFDTNVILTARPSGDSRFTGWSGGGCAGKATCTVGMNERRVVRARFQGLCVVPRLKGETVRAARKNIRKAHCRTGRTSRSYSKVIRVGRVISQRPRAERRLPIGTKVDLVVSKGRRPLP